MMFAVLVILAFCGVGHSAAFPPLGYERRLLKEAFEKPAAPAATAPKTNVWAGISATDNLEVWKLLHDPASGMNLTYPDDAVLTDNYVFWIDALHTNKSAVLPYIDGDGAIPAKYARAIIFEVVKAEPDSQEYMIGPLPVLGETTIQSDERTNLVATSRTPQSFDGSTSFRSIMFRFSGSKPGSASYMTPLDFFVLIDCTGTDAFKYSLKGFVTGEKYYTSAAELRAAFEAGALAKETSCTQHTGDRRQAVKSRPPEEKYVEYMNWSFYVSYSRTLGFDCPWGSTFWNVSYYSNNNTVTNEDAICIFETDMNFPLSRHRAAVSNVYGFVNLGTVKDYSFHMDGSLEVIVRTSGYLQSSFYYPDQQKWGPRIQQATQGSLHDHIITFKGDFDIVVTAKSLQVSELKAVNQSQPWFPELEEFEKREMEIANMETEQQFNWATNNQAMYTVISSNATNAWGEPRGYRISHLAVTVQHDTEPYCNSFRTSTFQPSLSRTSPSFSTAKASTMLILCYGSTWACTTL
ncbi:amine oxidase catalytic domain-containing protein [Bimuria novae-zelandiae CBS 107.79]|uniref:Amine oxidase n=1 Tax=Bimuria novae-zelandiae CBS 107.79 TaxID=1447943 RepID=A0A6A5VCZ5_9PLEO|nr:amine oxidase catalytic domain-containing protein [Bimuria novae-zelandiae CBS 107.79]